MASCIFCEIVAGKIPSFKLCEDDAVLSFLDINPINPGHALVITKAHWSSIFDAGTEDLKKCMEVVQKLSKIIREVTNCDGINIVQNNLKAAGQLIDHFHIHIIPRFEGDGFLATWPGKPYKEMSAMKELGERIKSKLFLQEASK